jgi:hypothetical protein
MKATVCADAKEAKDNPELAHSNKPLRSKVATQAPFCSASALQAPCTIRVNFLANTSGEARTATMVEPSTICISSLPNTSPLAIVNILSSCFRPELNSRDELLPLELVYNLQRRSTRRHEEGGKWRVSVAHLTQQHAAPHAVIQLLHWRTSRQGTNNKSAPSTNDMKYNGETPT